MPFEVSLIKTLREVLGKSGVFDFFIIVAAEYLPFLMVFAAICIIFHGKSVKIRLSRFLFAGLTVLLSRGFITTLFSFFLTRERPFVSLGFMPIFQASGYSFPSGHAALLFALSFVIFSFNRKWGWWFIGLSLLNGFARVFAGVHWPSDIIGGIAVAFFSLAVIKLILPGIKLNKNENIKMENDSVKL